MMNPKYLAGFGNHWTPDDPIIPFDFAALVKITEKPLCKPKENALWAVFSHSTSTRAKEDLLDAEFWALWADIDEGNPTFETVKNACDRIFDDGMYLIYSTKSYDESIGKRKWRIIVPHFKPIPASEFLLAQRAFNFLLRTQKITPDPVTERIQQICFLPNAGKEYKGYVNKTNPQDYRGLESFTSAMIHIRELDAKEEADRNAQAIVSRRNAMARLESGSMSPVDYVNEFYDVRETLINYGYKPKGSKLLSPYSSTGVAGVKVDSKENRWYSSHGSDHSNIGRSNGDVFDLICHFEYGGDYKRAVSSLSREIITASGKTLDSANKDNFREKLADSYDKYSDLGEGTWASPPTTNQSSSAVKTKESSTSSMSIESDSLAHSAEECSTDGQSDSNQSTTLVEDTNQESSEVSETEQETTTELLSLGVQLAEAEAANDWGAIATIQARIDLLEAPAPEPDNGELPSPVIAEEKPLTDDELFEKAGLVERVGELEPVKWAIGGVMEQGALGIFAGEGGSGKTTLVLSIASSISSGQPFMGYPIMTQGIVLYVASEGGSGIRRRLDGYERMGYDTSNVMVLDMGLGFTENGTGILLELISRVRPVLVVIDTWGAQGLDIEDNDNAAVYHFLHTLNKKMNTACPFTSAIIVHHTPKGKAREVRGAAAFRDATSFTFTLSKLTAEEIKHKGSSLVFACSKQKEGKEFDEIYLDKEFVDTDRKSWDGTVEQMIVMTQNNAGGFGAPPPVGGGSSKNPTGDHEQLTKAIETLYEHRCLKLSEAEKRLIKLTSVEIYEYASKHYGFVSSKNSSRVLSSVAVKAEGGSKKTGNYFVPKGSFYSKVMDEQQSQAPVSQTGGFDWGENSAPADPSGKIPSW